MCEQRKGNFMKQDYDGPNRRRFKRLKASFPVVYQLKEPLDTVVLFGNREINSIMLDLGEGGTAIMTSFNIPVLTVVFVKFTMINPHALGDNRVTKIEVSGGVRYNIALERGEHRIGICFNNLMKEDKIAIANYVQIASINGPTT